MKTEEWIVSLVEVLISPINMEGCKRLMTFTMAMASLWNLCQSEYLEGRIKTLEVCLYDQQLQMMRRSDAAKTQGRLHHINLGANAP